MGDTHKYTGKHTTSYTLLGQGRDVAPNGNRSGAFVEISGPGLRLTWRDGRGRAKKRRKGFRVAPARISE